MASGYDGEGMVKFFQKLKAGAGVGDNKLLELLSDHPLDGDRVSAIKAEIERLKREKPELFVKKTPAPVLPASSVKHRGGTRHKLPFRAGGAK